MAYKGAGGRWAPEGEEEAQAREIDAQLAPRGDLSSIELVCFAAVIGLFFWLAQQLALRGGGAALFQGLTPVKHVFASLAIAVGAYMFALSGTPVPRLQRVAGTMLASVVSVVMLYVLLFLGQSLYVTGAAIALAAGSALCSRTGLPRNQGYPAALVAASIMMISYAGAATLLR